jgi:hypothetical protein
LRAEAIVAAKQDRLSIGDKQESRIAAGGTQAWSVINTRI